MTTRPRICRFCKTELTPDNAHCKNPHCTWCTACVRRREDECKGAK